MANKDYTTLNITLEPALFQTVDETRQRLGRSRSEFIRTALENYLARETSRLGRTAPSGDAVRWGRGFNTSAVPRRATRGRYRRRPHDSNPFRCVTVHFSKALLGSLDVFARSQHISNSHVSSDAVTVYLAQLRGPRVGRTTTGVAAVK